MRNAQYSEIDEILKIQKRTQTETNFKHAKTNSIRRDVFFVFRNGACGAAAVPGGHDGFAKSIFLARGTLSLTTSALFNEGESPWGVSKPTSSCFWQWTSHRESIELP